MLGFEGHDRWSVFCVCPYQKHLKVARAVHYPHEQCNQMERDFSQTNQLCSKCKGLFTVLIFLVSIWFWPYLPSYPSLFSLAINIGYLTIKILCLDPEKISLCHLLTLHISELSAPHLSLCRELWSRDDKWHFRKKFSTQKPSYLFTFSSVLILGLFLPTPPSCVLTPEALNILKHY